MTARSRPRRRYRPSASLAPPTCPPSATTVPMGDSVPCAPRALSQAGRDGGVLERRVSRREHRAEEHGTFYLGVPALRDRVADPAPASRVARRTAAATVA